MATVHLPSQFIMFDPMFKYFELDLFCLSDLTDGMTYLTTPVPIFHEEYKCTSDYESEMM